MKTKRFLFVFLALAAPFVAAKSSAPAASPPAVAKAADWLELLKAGWQTLRGVAGLAILGVVKTLEVLIKGVEWLSNKLLGTKSNWGETFGLMSDALVEVTDEAFTKAGESWDKFNNGVNSTAVAATFADIRAKADENADLDGRARR